MKKCIKTMLLLVILPFLFACGSNNEIQNEIQIESQRYIDNNHNIYENGRIYVSTSQMTTKAMYIDFNTLESVPLCAMPNCDHNNSKCISNIVGETPILCDGYVYYFNIIDDVNELGNGKREYYINTKLCRVSMATSEIEIISEFHDCVPHTTDGYFLNDNILYFTGTDMGPEEDEYGNIGVSNIGGTQFLCSINLDTGEYINYDSVYDGDKQYKAASQSRHALIQGFYNSKIYILYSFLEKELSMGEGTEGLDKYITENLTKDLDKFINLCFEFDLETKTLSQSDLPSPRYAESDVYVGYDIKSKKTTVIYNGERHELDAYTRHNASCINGKLFAFDEQKWYDLSDMSQHDMGEYGEYLVIAYYDNCYILANGAKTVKLTEEELLAL